MKKFTVICFLLIMSISTSFATIETTKLEGVFQGLDLYVNNPILDEGEGINYCITSIEINNEPYNDVINSSAFRIALSEMPLELGEPIKIFLNHEANCKPRIINPEILKPLSTYELVDINLGYENLLEFTTKGESAKLSFKVQQYRWGSWIDVAVVAGKGGPDNQTYKVKVYPHNGENKFRILQKDHLHKVNMSDEQILYVNKDSVTIMTNLKKVKKELLFSGETYYIMQNEFGEEVLEGYGDNINTSELEKGMYYLRYSNTWAELKKK